MSSVNKVIIIGNLGRDPDVRYTTGGMAIANLAIATSRQWKDKTSGERQEEVEWHRVVLFDRLAEVAGEYLKKGRPVYIEGRLRTRKWTDRDNIERYTTEICAEDMKMLGGRNDSSGEGQSGESGESAGRRQPSRAAPPASARQASSARAPARAAPRAPAAAPAAAAYAGDGSDDDDQIPF